MVRMKGAAYSATGLGSVSCKAWGKLNLNSVEPTVDERSEKKNSIWKDGWNWNLMSENLMGEIWVGEICFSKGKHVNMLEDREMEWNGWNPLCQKWKNNHEESSGTQTHPFSQLILMIIYIYIRFPKPTVLTCFNAFFDQKPHSPWAHRVIHHSGQATRGPRIHQVARKVARPHAMADTMGTLWWFKWHGLLT